MAKYLDPSLFSKTLTRADREELYRAMKASILEADGLSRSYLDHKKIMEEAKRAMLMEGIPRRSEYCAEPADYRASRIRDELFSIANDYREEAASILRRPTDEGRIRAGCYLRFAEILEEMIRRI